MTCVICRHGLTVLRKSTVVLEREGCMVVFRGVPAEVCEACGEQYLSSDITSRLLDEALRAARNGVEVEVRNFAAA